MKSVSSSTHELDLLDISLVLWKRRLVLVLSTLAFLVCGIVAASLQAPLFRGEVRVYPQDNYNLAGFNT